MQEKVVLITGGAKRVGAAICRRLHAAGAHKLGPAGDFTTAPEMTPLFGAAVATQVGAILEATAGREIVELGAGSGRLAGSSHRLGVAPRAKGCASVPNRNSRTAGPSRECEGTARSQERACRKRSC